MNGEGWMNGPSNKVLGAIYDFVRGREKTAFAILRATGGGAIALAGPVLKKFVQDVDLSSPIPDNHEANDKIEREELGALLVNGMIEEQDCEACSRIKVGIADLAFAGCGIIATYNLLVSFGERPNLAELIVHFEKNAIMLKGEFGTDPFKIAGFLEERGYRTTLLDPDYTGNGDRFIVTFWNDKDDIRDSAHTVLLTREADGTLCSHNNRDRGQRFASVADFFTCHPKVRPIMVLRVERETAG